MTYFAKYKNMLLDDDVRRWFENLKAKSILTATVYLRTLGFYCESIRTSPGKIIDYASSNPIEFRDEFLDFVRELESKGKAGSYIARFKRVLRSWTKFHNIDVKLNVNIKGENESPTLVNEKVPSKEELGKIIRKASTRGRVAVSLMAFAGLRPESLGNYEGTDGLKIEDIRDMKIKGGEIVFDKIPSIVIVRNRLSKASNQYFSFMPEEGTVYIKEYLEERMKNGEIIKEDSPLLQFDPRGIKKNLFLRTTLVARDIREAIRGAGLKMRPYVLRAYFATAMDIAESKGLISHPWRMFMMGHKGDIEARYSTNKRLPPDMIEEMRSSYKRCIKYLETRISEPSENEAKTYLQQQLLLAVGYKQDEIDRMELAEMDNEAFQKILKDKVMNAMTGNGSKQRLIDVDEIGKFLEKGYEFQASLPNGKAVMKLPF